MKKQFAVVFAAASLVLPAAAKVTGEYVFTGPEVKDVSGNGNAPLTRLTPEAFVKEGEFAGAKLAKGIRIPFAAFPGKSGVLESEFLVEPVNEPRHLLIVYGKGDVLTLLIRRDRLQIQHLHRAANKWTRSKLVPIPTDAPVKVRVAWTLPGKVEVAVDGAVQLTEPVASADDFAPGSVVCIGSNQRGELAFPGIIKSVKFSDK